jgi:hypothetical protein
MAEAIILPSFEFTNTMGIRGFHVYMKDWKPYAKERLELLPERNDKHDPCAVAVIKRMVIDGFEGEGYEGRYQTMHIQE